MTLSEMLPTIQSLPRADKLRLIQLLAADVARDEGIALDMTDKTIPIWPPHDSFQGAATLLRIQRANRMASLCAVIYSNQWNTHLEKPQHVKPQTRTTPGPGDGDRRACSLNGTR